MAIADNARVVLTPATGAGDDLKMTWAEFKTAYAHAFDTAAFDDLAQRIEQDGISTPISVGDGPVYYLHLGG